jgi:hypothetical protein
MIAKPNPFPKEEGFVFQKRWAISVTIQKITQQTPSDFLNRTAIKNLLSTLLLLKS